ncbi:MAG TPA: class I SAM-dependent methyltransferase [Pseudonocardiaceae bacterium]
MSAALAAALAARSARPDGSIGSDGLAAGGPVGAGGLAQSGGSARSGAAGSDEFPVGGLAETGGVAVGGEGSAGWSDGSPVGGLAEAGGAAIGGAGSSGWSDGSGGSVGSAGVESPRGGALVLVDAVPELLASAADVARAVPGVAGVVDVRTVRVDLAAADPAVGELPAADLVWASNVAHHLPDQRQAVSALTAWLAPGGCLALSEGGLSMRCLPWDVGVGEPGLQDRLIAAHGTWFHRMRSEMRDVVRLPVGWNLVLAEAGLSGVTAFSYLIDVPAPLTDTGRTAVVSWLAWMARTTTDLLAPADVVTLNRLLDPADPVYVGRRDDVFLLKASTVYLGWRT